MVIIVAFIFIFFVMWRVKFFAYHVNLKIEQDSPPVLFIITNEIDYSIYKSFQKFSHLIKKSYYLMW
jgi:hypothetical protein